jgi:hypothetical protein
MIVHVNIIFMHTYIPPCPAVRSAGCVRSRTLLAQSRTPLLLAAIECRIKQTDLRHSRTARLFSGVISVIARTRNDVDSFAPWIRLVAEERCSREDLQEDL